MCLIFTFIHDSLKRDHIDIFYTAFLTISLLTTYFYYSNYVSYCLILKHGILPHNGDILYNINLFTLYLSIYSCFTIRWWIIIPLSDTFTYSIQTDLKVFIPMFLNNMVQEIGKCIYKVWRLLNKTYQSFLISSLRKNMDMKFMSDYEWNDGEVDSRDNITG